MTIFII